MTILGTNAKLPESRKRLKKINPPGLRLLANYRVIVLPLEMAINNPTPCSDKLSHSHREKNL